MKNFLLIAALLITAFGFSQDKDKVSIFKRKHEIKIGAIKLLAGPILEGTYEYIYSKDFTFGSSILVSLDESDYYNEEFSITPFARFYFQETKEYGAQGFFVEGFAKYFSGKYDQYNLFGSAPKEFSAAALGIGVGKKWINSSGFVFETLIGFGRTLGGADYKPEAVFRGDLSIGYRF
jgi:hypothetical protein